MLTLNRKGFTLIELLVVIAIIGILSSVVLVSLNSARAKANAAKATGDLSQVMTAVEMAISDGCPSTSTISVLSGSAIQCGGAGTKYLASAPTAPAGYTYNFGAAAVVITPGTTYTLTATGFGDTGSFNCIDGSCSCSTSTLCKQ